LGGRGGRLRAELGPRLAYWSPNKESHREQLRLRRGGGQPLAGVQQLLLPAPGCGQLEYPTAPRADELASQGDHTAPKGFGAVQHAVAQSLTLVEHQKVEGQNLEFQVGPIGQEKLSVNTHALFGVSLILSLC
jgi:hypothetical protein